MTALKIPRSFLKFALSGVSSAALDLGLFQLFCLMMKDGFGSVSYVFLATVFARIISAIYNHAVNHYLVFKGTRNYKQSAMRYFTLAFVQGFCSATLTSLIFNIVQCELEIYVKLPVDIVLFLISYFIQKSFVF